MTDLSKLTAKDFSDAMHKGWKGLSWAKFFFITKKGNYAYTPRYAVACCALGAMARHLKTDPDKVSAAIPHNIIPASDTAGNKRAAMKAVDAILLNTPAVRGGE